MKKSQINVVSNESGLKWIGFKQGRNQLFNPVGGNFYELSFDDDVIMLIQPWWNFSWNGQRWTSLRNISENENFSVLIKMQTEWSLQNKN